LVFSMSLDIGGRGLVEYTRRNTQCANSRISYRDLVKMVTIQSFLQSFNSKMEEPVRQHLKNVYACLTMSAISAGVGAYVHIYTQLLSFRRPVNSNLISGTSICTHGHS
ncbi:hypothetical protein L9F63_025277, partial [Diploptera punctata]